MFTDAESIELTEADIDDPHAHVDITSLSKCKIEHLKSWLLYRGDKLHNIYTSKSAEVRVLEYFENNTRNKLIDPTTDSIISMSYIENHTFQYTTLKYPVG